MRITDRVIGIVFPPLVGIFVVVISLQVRIAVSKCLFPENYVDLPFLIEPFFDIALLFPIYIIAYVVAVIFQFFVGLRIWNTYKQGNRILT